MRTDKRQHKSHDRRRPIQLFHDRRANPNFHDITTANPIFLADGMMMIYNEEFFPAEKKQIHDGNDFLQRSAFWFSSPAEFTVNTTLFSND